MQERRRRRNHKRGGGGDEPRSVRDHFLNVGGLDSPRAVHASVDGGGIGRVAHGLTSYGAAVAAECDRRWIGAEKLRFRETGGVKRKIDCCGHGLRGYS